MPSPAPSELTLRRSLWVRRAHEALPNFTYLNRSECSSPSGRFIRGTNVESLVGGAGMTSEGKEVYLRDIWPSREEVRLTEEDTIIASIFKDLKGRTEVRQRSFLPSRVSNYMDSSEVKMTRMLPFQKGNIFWNNIECPDSVVFPWDHKSTYIRSPSFFSKLVSVLVFAVILYFAAWLLMSHCRVSLCVFCLRVKRFHRLSRSKTPMSYCSSETT